MPAIPESTKSSLQQRLGEHATQHWPQLRNVQVRFRGTFAYVSGRLQDGEVLPLCRLRYGGSAARWGFAIYLASKDGYEDSILPTGGLPVPARGCKGCGCRVRAGFGVVCGRGWLSFLPPMMAVACERVVGSTVGRKADRAATPYGAVDAAAREQTIRRWAGRTAVVAPARWRLRLWV
jgi:hypothetical protein